VRSTTRSSSDVLAILDRIMRQVAKRLARETRHDDAPPAPDVLAIDRPPLGDPDCATG
jgi:hypothetical protein